MHRSTLHTFQLVLERFNPSLRISTYHSDKKAKGSLATSSYNLSQLDKVKREWFCRFTNLSRLSPRVLHPTSQENTFARFCRGDDSLDDPNVLLATTIPTDQVRSLFISCVSSEQHRSDMLVTPGSRAQLCHRVPVGAQHWATGRNGQVARSNYSVEDYLAA